MDLVSAIIVSNIVDSDTKLVTQTNDSMFVTHAIACKIN